MSEWDNWFLNFGSMSGLFSNISTVPHENNVTDLLATNWSNLAYLSGSGWDDSGDYDENASLLNVIIPDNTSYSDNDPSILGTEDRELIVDPQDYYDPFDVIFSNVRSAKTNSTSDTFLTPLQLNNSRMCGLPGFCKASAYDSCFNISISNCNECSKPGSIFFILLVVCLGLAILIGNLIILAVGWKRHKSGKASKMDVCRCSLAIADLLTGKYRRL